MSDPLSRESKTMERTNVDGRMVLLLLGVLISSTNMIPISIPLLSFNMHLFIVVFVTELQHIKSYGIIMVVVVVVVQECEVLLVIPVDGMHAVNMRTKRGILRMRLRKMMRDAWWWYGVIGGVFVVNKVDDIICRSMLIRSSRLGIG